MKKKNVRWTPEEDQVLIKSVGNYPTNLKFAFEQASGQLNKRTAQAVMNRYYTLNSKAGATSIIALASHSGNRVLNRKNSPIPRKAKTEEMRMEIVMGSIDKMTRDQKREVVKYILEI